MRKIVLIDTGGTFNKCYDPIRGTLEIDTSGHALQTIAKQWLCAFETIQIIGKDSLLIEEHDRALLTQTILSHNASHYVVIHGTDTIDITARYLQQYLGSQRVVLTGAMVPFSIDPIEATANLALAIGYLTAEDSPTIAIALNGVVDHHTRIKKDRTRGKFISYPLQ